MIAETLPKWDKHKRVGNWDPSTVELKAQTLKIPPDRMKNPPAEHLLLL